MSRGRCFVELKNGKAYRILRFVSYDPNEPSPVEMPRIEAVGEIREQVFARAAGRCERCATPITTKAHMHEVKPRGHGGEISVENSIALCARCHIGETGVHKNHYPQWSKGSTNQT